MSLYNHMFGVNSNALTLLKILGTSEEGVPRFRDCFITEGKICIHTRTGGGNREYYESEEACRENYPGDFGGDDAPCGPWNADLRALPGFISDEDDDFDSTYANFYYEFPAAYADDLKALELDAPDYLPSEKWKMLFAEGELNDTR